VPLFKAESLLLSAAICVRDPSSRAVQPGRTPIDKYLCQNRRELQAAANSGRRFSRWKETYSLSPALRWSNPASVFS